MSNNCDINHTWKDIIVKFLQSNTFTNEELEEIIKQVEKKKKYPIITIHLDKPGGGIYYTTTDGKDLPIGSVSDLKEKELSDRITIYSDQTTNTGTLHRIMSMLLDKGYKLTYIACIITDYMVFEKKYT